MMYSMEKCLGRNGTGTPEEAELFAGDEVSGRDGAPEEDAVLASAVAAVSHEIGDILKDELGAAHCADRLGAELADLGAELGLLAGLAEPGAKQDFPALLKLAMGSRECESSDSSSSWSRRAPRPARHPRRRPIAKGKEVSRRRSAAARRALCVRARRAEAGSDASDVGADSDSDDQWTELDASPTPSGSGSSSSDTSSTSNAGVDLDDYRPPEIPQLRQFLLPLISNVPNSVQFRIRHDDIVQLLATEEEEPSLADLPALRELVMYDDLDELRSQSVEDLFPFEEPPVTTEEEAALLHYVCGGPRESATFQPTEDWLLGMFHSWCEVSALIYTLIGTDASAGRVLGPWAYRARAGCHCRLCVSRARAEPALAALLRTLVWALAHGGSTVPHAAHLMRALCLGADRPLAPDEWDLPRLRRIHFSDEGVAIIHNQLVRYSMQNETARQIITLICNCREYDKPLEKEFAVERLIRILECYKAASIINFQVDIVPLNDDPDTNRWINESRDKLRRYLVQYQESPTSTRIQFMAARYQPSRMSVWDGYVHSCECLTPKILCAQQRKLLLRSIYSRMSAFGLKHSASECDEDDLPVGPTPIPSQRVLYSLLKAKRPEPTSGELQQGDGTGAKPPDSESASATQRQHETTEAEPVSDGQSDANAELDDSSFLTVTDSEDHSGSASLGLSTSSLDSASELLLAAAHAVDSDGQPAPTQLCRTVRHLMRSIASIERHMDTVLKQCDEWPAGGNDVEARKQVDLGLSAVDRKLMAMYRRLPEVHRRQLQVYRKQKKLSTVCMQLVGGAAPAPPPPGSPPPAPHHLPDHTLCPEYHLQRFKEVRRKVMHMRDQQLYYHRLRMWLEDQLRQERESVPDGNVTLLGDLQRRKRRTSSPRLPRLSTATKRKLKPTTISKPHRILQLLKHKAQANDDSEASPPDAFPLERDDNSDADTVVGEKEDMNQVIATLAQIALNPDKRIQQVIAELREEYANAKPSSTDSEEEEYPESVSPPLQEMSPTTSEPMPVYTPKPTQRLINKFTDKIDFNAQIAPLNARTPVLIKEEKEPTENSEVTVYKDPNIYKYVTFGLEIKKAMEECQNIINSYNSIKTEKEKDSDTDGPLSLEQICEVMMSLDKNSAEFLTKLDTDEPIDMNTANTKLAELVENMPQILANMPEIASEFANASFELPEFASIMNSLPDVSGEAQLTPETLKQIRDLKLNKRDSVKVTKNTAKRKISRKIKSNIDTSDIIGTLTFEFDSKDIADLLKDEKELQALMKCKTQNKEEFKDLLFSISAQVVINKVFEYMKASTNPELTKCIKDEIFALPRSNINAEMYAKAATLFDNSVKDSLSMDELRATVRARFNTWKTYVTNEFKNIPITLLDTEVEGMLDKFYLYIKDLASKQGVCEREKIIEKLEDKKEQEITNDECPPPKESLKQITKILSVSVGNTFDLLLMKMSRMTGEKRAALKNMRIKYVDVLKRCAESQQLATWILSDPDLAASHIQELMGFGVTRSQEKTPDFYTMPVEKKRAYFIDRLKSINRHFMDNIPRHNVTGDEWLVMLYRLEQFENKIRDTLVKFSPVAKTPQNVSEAEILAAKGLSKIIGKANNVRVVKIPASAVTSITASAGPVSKPSSTKALPAAKVTVPATKTTETPSVPKPITIPTSIPIPLPPSPVKKDDKPEPTSPKENTRRDVIIKCETLIAQKGNKALKDSFDAIKAYLAGEVSKPENYHDHVMAIVTNLDYSALDDEMVEVLQFGGITISPPAPTKESTVKVHNLAGHNPEELAKYSAQALRNAKQTLNAVAFKNLSRNGQSKSESDISSCDVPSSECKYTSDCMCAACKRDRSICLGDIVKISFDPSNPEKSKAMLEEKRKEKEVKVKTPAKAKPVPKQCENATHQQHVCKVGHTNNGNGSCTGDGGDQHCTCCYCTVFGHAPPLTTPVPRNFNETRERLRSILNKKKQLCKTANGEPPQDNKSPQPDKKPLPATQPVLKLAQPQPKPPALPKTLPPNLTAQAQAKRQALDSQQRMLADKMAKMVVTEKPEIKPVALQRTGPVQVNVPPSLKAEGKVNPNAMEQIRLQQLKQQQQAQFAQQLAQQKKPEPIYDLPIHNKPPQQQQQIRQELQKQQLQKQLLLQQKLKQNPVVSIAPQTPTQNPPQTTPQVQQQIQQQIQQPVQIQQKPTQQIPVPVQPQIQKPTPQQVPQKPVQQVPPKPVPQVQQPVQQVQQKPIQQVQQKPLQQVQQKPVQAQQPQQIQKAPQPVNRVTPQTAQPQKPVQPQLLQKPPIQQAPRKPPPQELQQKLAQKQQQPIQKPVQPVTPQLTPQQLQQQQLQQQQLRQQQLQQQQLQQQRQSRQPNQNSVSLSSRDTSVFSTSSGCSDGSCWQGRAEDTRDLDALLQYIEGPTRHVDRGKKKAKKLRQKAKKTEERLSEECAQLKIELARVRFEAEALRVAHYSAKRRCDETRKALQVMSANNTSSKNRKKQNKLSPTQKQQVQVLAEQVGELTALMNTTAKELHTAESEVAECSQKLRRCEKEINEARYIQGKKTPIHMSPEDIKKYQNEQHEQLLEQEKMKLQQEEAQRLRTNAQWLQQQQLQQQLQQQQLQQQQLQQQQRRQQQQMQLQQRQMQMEQEIMNQIRIDEAKLLKQRQNEAIAKADRLEARGGSSSSGGSVSSTGAERGGSSPASCGSNAKHMEDDEKQQKSDVRKLTQTWEQALAHINQVAKGTKDKKKQKPAAPVKPEPKQKEKLTIEEPPPLSKKQRKKLAQQQAEEEERQQQEALQKQEARRKKKEPASPDPKAEPLTRKAEKKLEQAKRAEEAKTKKDAKRERKLEKKAEKKEEKKAKEKENNPEKNAQVPKQNKQPTPPPALTKKERKREQLLLQKQQEGKPQVVNITPHTTIEVVNKKNGSAMESDKPASCSIMEQLSSGIQVSELRLPPGITLTRVQPHEKKEPPTIKSVPLWKASQLPAAPTPVARPQPVINADPSMMMFSTAHPEPPKPIIVAEPTAPTGKSKKAKKKAKKAAAAEEPKPEGTKMVTLRNPMFHPNLPPVQVSNSPPAPSNPKKPEIRLPDPIPMPPNACQATITPTSNGMYTIRNPLMSMMHQQSMVRNPTPPFNQYKYPNPKFQNYETSPKPDDYQNRIMNLASFTQKNDEGYSLFKTPDNVHKSFLSPEYYGEEPKPVVSPNPIGTRPEASRFEDSLFTTPVPEPIGTPLKRDDDRSEYTGLYTPFGVENPNLFRNALFNEKDEVVMNGDLPYFQRLRVGSKLNSEVTIHHVTESKFYRQEPGAPLEEAAGEASLFSRAWPEPLYAPPPPTGGAAEGAEPRYGAVGTRPQRDHESSIYLPEATGGKLSSLEACEREMESFKRFEWYFSPEPTPIQLNVNDNSINK